MNIYVLSVLLGLVVLGLAGPVEQERKDRIADKQYLKRYKEILQLFDYINQPSYYKEIIDIAKNYDLQKNSNSYLKPDIVEYFLSLYNYGLLPRGEIFSIFYKEQLKQAKALFKLFYYAKDYDTFYKTACWARQNLNEGLFLYSFSVALRQRADTQNFELPPIYEIYPYYFFNTEVIQRAYYYKQKYYGEISNKKEKDFDGYTIYANYSGYYLNLNPEQSLSYYLEDIGLNSYYYYYSINYPFWLSSDDYTELKRGLFAPRGEIFYYSTQQLLARYYLERLANNFGDIPDFEWDLPFKTGYYPSLRYANGLEFPNRPNFALLKDYLVNYGQKICLRFPYKFASTNVQDYERRLRDLIDRGKIFNNGKEIDLYSEEGLNILGNLIESNADSLNRRYYGPILFYARHLLGYTYQPKSPYQIAPSALEQYETSLRDPAFYQLYKRIFYLFLKYQQNLPAYSKKDLYFPGVSIKKAEFSKLETYYDYFYSDIGNAVYYSEEEAKKGDFRVRAKQYRLNNRPFNYKLYVNSDKPYLASIRVYLGPKLDEYGRPIDIITNRINFVHFDYFSYNLSAGENIIERNSLQLNGFCDDCRSYRQIYKEVLEACNGKSEYRISSSYNCFPRRLALPKGSLSGRPYQFYFIVSPYKERFAASSQEKLMYAETYDDYPLGYPFDRNIYESSYYNVPNAYFYDAKIYYDDSINKFNALSD